MKKILLVLALVLVLMLGAAVWLVSRSMGTNEAASLLPEQTVAYFSLTDLPRSIIRWPNTALAQIGVEPEMKAFLDKPLQALSKNGSANEGGNILWSLKPRRIFAAAVAVSPQNASLLVGFQFFGSKAALEDALKRLRHELAAGGPEVEVTRENSEGVEITSSIHQGTTLFCASVGAWGFLSNNRDVIQDALDRAVGRKTEGSLAGSERYKKTVTHLPKDSDFLVYVQPQTILDALLAIGSGMGAQPDPKQLEQFRKIEAVGAALKIDGADLHDSAFVLYPNPPEIGTLSHAGAGLAGKDTIAYFDAVIDLQQFAAASQNPAWAGLMNSPALQTSRLVELLPQAFGPEFALFSSWDAQGIRPTAVAALQVKDTAKAQESVQQILTLYPDTAVSEQGSAKLYSFPALKGLFYNPTMALTDKFLFIGVDGSDLQHVLAPASGDSLEKSPDFAPAMSSFRKANQVFGYIDTKAIFTRSYPMLRQILMFQAAVMPNDVVDATKLPQTESIARHLNPILYSQSRLPDGFLMESSGPVTLNQVILLGTIGGATFFKSSH